MNKEQIEVCLYSSWDTLDDMVRVSIDKIERKFWIPTIGSAIAIKRLSIKGCTVEHYEVVDYKLRIHIYQFYRKRSSWIPKIIEEGAVSVSDKELSILREIVNVVDVYDQLEQIWLLLSLLGINNKVCADIVGYAFGIYFHHKSYNLKVIKI